MRMQWGPRCSHLFWSQLVSACCDMSLLSLGSQVITVFEGVFLQVSYFFSSWSVTEPSALKLWMAGVAEAAGQLACDSLSAPKSSQSIH